MSEIKERFERERERERNFTYLFSHFILVVVVFVGHKLSFFRDKVQLLQL